MTTPKPPSKYNSKYNSKSSSKICGYEPEPTGFMNTNLSYNRVSKTVRIEVRSFEKVPTIANNGMRGNVHIKFVLLPHNTVKTVKLSPEDVRIKLNEESLNVFVYFKIKPEKNLKNCILLIDLHYISRTKNMNTWVGESFVYLPSKITKNNGSDHFVKIKFLPIPVDAYKIGKNIVTWNISQSENIFKFLLGTIFRSDTGRLEIKILAVDLGKSKSLIKKTKIDVIAFDSNGKLISECTFDDLPLNTPDLIKNTPSIDDLVMDASFPSNSQISISLGFLLKLKSFSYCNLNQNMLCVLHPESSSKSLGVFIMGKYKLNAEGKNQGDDDFDQLESSSQTPDKFILKWHKFQAP